MTDINNDKIVDIHLSNGLKQEGVVEHIKIYKILDSLEIIVNHRAEKDTVYVSKVSKKDLKDISKEVEKRLKELGLNDKQRLLIKNNISNEWKLFAGLCDTYDIYDEPKNEGNTTNLIKYPNEEDDDKEQENQEQNKEGKIIDDDSLEIISPSQALRKNLAEYYKVKGTITSITKPFKMVIGVQFYCLICKQHQESFFELPEYDVSEYYSPKCQYCKKSGITIVVTKPIHINSINIELQNSDTFDDLESLPVFLFDKYTEGIRVGETVEIPGVINILNIKKKYYTFFYGKSIKYLNREDLDLTESDIRIIKRFKEIHKDRVIVKLVEMVDPSIVEHDVPKKTILISAVNTSEKIGDDSEHTDVLFIGPPGTAKSKLLRRATKLVPGSSNAGGQYSSGKSLIAVIDKVNDNTILRIGLVPRSRGAFCAINEFGRQDPEDQDKMLDVMQEREFDFSKYGINVHIPAPTTILASANPKNNDKWIDDDKIDLSQFPFLEPIIDRFDLIVTFHDKKTDKERNEFVEKLSQIEAKKAAKKLPDYTQFLVKYIQYAKKFNPVLTAEARNMLAQFAARVLNQGFGSPRVVIALPKIVKAIARLKLKNIADAEDAEEVMELYNALLSKFQKHVTIPQNPKDLACEKGLEIIKRFEKFGGISLEELIKDMCEEERQLAIHFGYGERSLKMSSNSKVRDVYKLLKRNPHILIKDEKPVVLKWICDTYDIYDKDKISKNPQNEEKNNEKPDKNDLEPVSYISHISHSEVKEEEEQTIKGMQFSAKGPIHLEGKDLN